MLVSSNRIKPAMALLVKCLSSRFLALRAALAVVMVGLYLVFNGH